MNTHEWLDGVLSSIMREICAGKSSCLIINGTYIFLLLMVFFMYPIHLYFVYSLESSLQSDYILQQIILPSSSGKVLHEIIHSNTFVLFIKHVTPTLSLSVKTFYHYTVTSITHSLSCWVNQWAVEW